MAAIVDHDVGQWALGHDSAFPALCAGESLSPVGKPQSRCL